jgi:uncharacterized protein
MPPMDGVPAQRARPRVNLVVVQPTPFCNIDCRYCYLPRRNDRDVIDDRTLVNLFGKLWRSGWVGRDIHAVWHAGEPTVLPPRFYRRAFALADSERPDGVRLTHSFQTNATLLDEEWCDLIERYEVRVGVSIDGPASLNDRNRVTRAGRSSFDKALRGLRLLKARGIPFQVITVLSSASLDAARELHDFYVAEGVERVGFNVEETEGDHVSALDRDGDICERYRRFLTEFWALAAQSGRIKAIREIDQILGAVYAHPHRRLGNELVSPFALLNVDCFGNVSTFSPELLGQKNADYDDFVLGNINHDELHDILAGPRLAKLASDIAAGTALCQAECGYFDLCGGGEPVNKLSENGSFASSATTFCRLTRMTLADLVCVGPHAA